MIENCDKLDPKVLKALKEFDLIYKVFLCDSDFADTYAFCEKYGFTLSQSANTIIVAGKSDPVKYACCVALADSKLDVNKKVCALLEVKKASFAPQETAAEITGMMIGGVTVLGIHDMPIFIDSRVLENKEIVLGGGNRSSKILLDPRELIKIPGVEIVEGLAVEKIY